MKRPDIESINTWRKHNGDWALMTVDTDSLIKYIFYLENKMKELSDIIIIKCD